MTKKYKTLGELDASEGDVVRHATGTDKKEYTILPNKYLSTFGETPFTYSFCWDSVSCWELVSRASDKARTLVVGQSYKSHNGHKWEAIFSDGEHVWMKGEGDTYAAYVWSIEGKAISFGDEGPWDVDFGPILALEMVQITDNSGWPIGMGEVTMKDGEPDWSTLKVKEATNE